MTAKAQKDYIFYIRKLLLITVLLVLAILVLPNLSARAQVVKDVNFLPQTQVVATPKWQIPLDSEPGGVQIVDLDKNGTLEMVFSTEKSIYIVSKDGNIIKQIPISYTDTHTPPVIINMDKDPALEIVTGSGRSVGAWNMDGTQVPGWPRPVNREYVSAVMAGDLERDGVKDIIAVSYDYTGTSDLNVWNSKGEARSGFPRTFNYWPGTPALADLNSNGTQKIIFPTMLLGDRTGESKLYVIKPNGTNLPGFPFSANTSMGTASVADLNKDGKLEVIVSSGYTPHSLDYPLYVLNSDGTKYSNWNVKASDGSDQFSLGDFNNDGKIEVAMEHATAGGEAYVYDYSGKKMKGWPISLSSDWGGLQTPIIVDINGDNKADFISSSTTGKIFAGNLSGQLIPININTAPLMALHIGINDFYNNGKLEVAVLGSDYGKSYKLFFYALNSKFNPSTFLWKSERHDLRNSGRYTIVPGTLSTASDLQAFDEASSQE